MFFIYDFRNYFSSVRVFPRGIWLDFNPAKSSLMFSSVLPVSLVSVWIKQPLATMITIILTDSPPPPPKTETKINKQTNKKYQKIPKHPTLNIKIKQNKTKKPCGKQSVLQNVWHITNPRHSDFIQRFITSAVLGTGRAFCERRPVYSCNRRGQHPLWGKLVGSAEAPGLLTRQVP